MSHHAYTTTKHCNLAKILNIRFENGIFKIVEKITHPLRM